MTVGTCQPKFHLEVIKAGSNWIGPEIFVLSDGRDMSAVLFEVWNVWLFELGKVWLGSGA